MPVQPLPAGKIYSAGIVLGGYANEDGKGGGYFSSSANRFIQAVKLRNTGRVSRLVITGGNAGLNPTAFREGAWVKGQLKYFGVADSTALVDPDSRNTIENALNSRRVLDSAGLKPPYLLITSSYHMRRSLYIFKQAGIQVVPYVCDYDADSEPSLDDLIPEASVLPKWNLYIKEMVGLWVTYFKKIPGR
ncbi:MAG: YdcF family protein [Sphingobacteriales bacterium]|nr:MAG: YdcF family protein [Sphingobacteriales bacterium]